MYGAPNIFYFVHLIVKTVEMMVQRADFERNLKNIRPATVVWPPSKIQSPNTRNTVKGFIGYFGGVLNPPSPHKKSRFDRLPPPLIA